MHILITGNMGYVGSVLTKHLRSVFPDAVLSGYDCGYFAGNLANKEVFPERELNHQYFGDIRHIDSRHLAGVSCIVHLAAISNDPMGKAFENVTKQINYEASMRLALLAAEAGVSNFVFASSCSVYGAAGDAPRTESDELNPLTAYAYSKVDTEKGLEKLASPGFRVTCLRFATACGFSPRIRLDLVLNDFVAAATKSQKIKILSDGKPWRPLIHVKDMARAMEWASANTDKAYYFLKVNVGSAEWNYKVLDLAEEVKKQLPSVEIAINPDAQPDKRSYRVDFSRYLALAPDHQPVYSLSRAVEELSSGFGSSDILQSSDENSFIRLKTLQLLRVKNMIDADLYWNSK